MADGDDGGTGLIGKLIATAIVLFLAPFVEIGTSAFPGGVLGAIVALAIIWGFDEEADEFTDQV